MYAYFQECYHTYRKCSNLIWLIFPLFSRHGLKTKSHTVLKETKTVRIIKVWKNYVLIYFDFWIEFKEREGVL